MEATKRKLSEDEERLRKNPVPGGGVPPADPEKARKEWFDQMLEMYRQQRQNIPRELIEKVKKRLRETPIGPKTSPFDALRKAVQETTKSR